MKENKFERISEVREFEDFRGVNLSDRNFSNVSFDIIKTINFDSSTKWPNKENLPANFNPEIILENGKNPGLGIRELHEQGITGKGINVAIIDQTLDLNHEEYSDTIVKYKEFGRKEDISMHGPGVASLFVGKNCGIAPEAKLHYNAVPSGDDSNWDDTSASLNEIIAYNNKAEDKDKIKVVSYSNGCPNPAFKGDMNNWKKTIEKARNNGIIFVDVNTFFGFNFGGGGSIEKENINKYQPFLFGDRNIEYLKRMDPSWNNKERIIVPSDYRTIASSWNKEDENGNDEYAYNGAGGISWSIPYLAGIFTLMLQIKNDLKEEEMVKIIQDTVFENKDGVKVVNPKKIIEVVQNI